MYSIASLSKEFVRNTVAAALSLLVASVVYLSRANERLHDKVQSVREQLGAEIVTIERRCALEKDALRIEQLAAIRDALERQEQIEKKIKRLKK